MRFTSRAEGDLGHAGAYVEVDAVSPAVAARRAAIVPFPWTWLRQVHGDRIVEVGAPGDGAGEQADGSVSRSREAALAVFAADCAPIVLAAPEGVVAVVHAGWQGLVAGVIEAGVAEVRRLGGSSVVAALGPCIHAECYEFGERDLDRVATRLGDVVRATTTAGAAALDVPTAVRVALARSDARLTYEADACTACAVDAQGAPLYFSHRARTDTGRQAGVAWLP